MNKKKLPIGIDVTKGAGWNNNLPYRFIVYNKEKTYFAFLTCNKVTNESDYVLHPIKHLEKYRDCFVYEQ